MGQISFCEGKEKKLKLKRKKSETEGINFLCVMVLTGKMSVSVPRCAHIIQLMAEGLLLQNTVQGYFVMGVFS